MIITLHMSGKQILKSWVRVSGDVRKNRPKTHTVTWIDLRNMVLGKMWTIECLAQYLYN